MTVRITKTRHPLRKRKAADTARVTWAETARMLAILRKTRETTGRQGDVNSAAQDTTE